MEGIRGPGFPWDCLETVPELIVNQSKAEWLVEVSRAKKEVDSQNENQMAKGQWRIEEGSMRNWNKGLCAQRPRQLESWQTQKYGFIQAVLPKVLFISLPTLDGKWGCFAQILTRKACGPEIKPIILRDGALGMGCSLLTVWGSQSEVYFLLEKLNHSSVACFLEYK